MDKSKQDQTFLTQQPRKRSTFEEKYLERYGVGDDKRIGLPGLSPQLADKQKEMEETNDQLEEARVKFEKWKGNFQQKKKELEEKQQKLAEQKRSLDLFTLHHNAELEKAKQREAEEIEQARIIDNELQALTKEEEQLHTQNEALKKELDRLQPCADYLQSVVEYCQSFDNIESILHRHHSLAQTRAEYLEKYQKLMARYGLDEIELGKELETRKSHLINSTMTYNNWLAKIQHTKKLNEYKKTTVVKDIQRIDEKSTELAEIKTAIRNIYNRALEQSFGSIIKQKERKDEPEEEQMLNYITNRYNDLKEIIEDPGVVYINPPPPGVKRISTQLHTQQQI